MQVATHNLLICMGIICQLRDLLVGYIHSFYIIYSEGFGVSYYAFYAYIQGHTLANRVSLGFEVCILDIVLKMSPTDSKNPKLLAFFFTSYFMIKLKKDDSIHFKPDQII